MEVYRDRAGWRLHRDCPCVCVCWKFSVPPGFMVAGARQAANVVRVHVSSLPGCIRRRAEPSVGYEGQKHASSTGTTERRFGQVLQGDVPSQCPSGKVVFVCNHASLADVVPDAALKQFLC